MAINFEPDEEKHKVAERFMNEHRGLFMSFSGIHAYGQYEGEFTKNNNIVINTDYEPSKRYLFYFDSDNTITEVYDVTVGKVRIY